LVSTNEVTLAAIEAARERVREFVRLTPTIASQALTDRAGTAVTLKLENLQRTGSFKVRGANNMLASLDVLPPGVVAASAGNHAQAVALAATQRGIASTVVMPMGAPAAKQQACRGYGATIELVEGSLAACQTRARELATERGLLYIPPYDSPEIIAGQGTLGLELLEQEPELQTILVPAGGGGLLAGVAIAVKSRRPDVRVIGVQSTAMNGIVASLGAGAPVAMLPRDTIADGVAVAGPSELTLELIERYVDDVVDVDEESIARAIVFLLERARVVAEGAGALAVAALMSGKIEPSGATPGAGTTPGPGKMSSAGTTPGAGRMSSAGTTVAVISGGNIDVNLLDRLVDRGLVADGRRKRLTVATANVPGELVRISGAMAEARANIVQVEHDLAAPDLPVGVSRITLVIELPQAEVYERVREHLIAAGLSEAELTDFQTSAAANRPS
jgi:threonine dehydratase